MHTLTRDDLLAFHTQGYAGPFNAFEQSEALKLRNFFDENIIEKINDSALLSHVHVISKTVVQTVTPEPILNAVKQIVGEDVLLWKATFILKRPHENSDDIKWHQDSYYKQMHPFNAVLIWLALDDITLENGCIEILPGTHWHDVPHIKSNEGYFLSEADQRFFDSAAPSKKLVCKAGQFYIFNERAIHRSGINESDKKRIALLGRFAGTNVFIHRPKTASILVSGEDKYNYNHLVKVPTEL